MPPNKIEPYSVMQNYNNDDKHAYMSPVSTKSGSIDGSKLRGSRRRLIRLGGAPDLIPSPSTSNRRGSDVRGIISPSFRDTQLMRQVSGLDLDDFELPDGNDTTFAGDEEQQQQERLHIRGTQVEGTIAPSRTQRQLMRQVSALGLEDPVFGDNLGYDDSIKKENQSFIFDDMPRDAIPKDMQDMISLASDRTDKVETDDGQSYDSKSLSSMQPLGLEPGTDPSLQKKVIKKGKRPKRPKHRTRSREQTTHSQSITSDPNYEPPAPFFEKTRRKGNGKAERRGSNCTNSVGSIASVEKASKAVDRMTEHAIAGLADKILNMNASKAGSGHSRASYTSHSRMSHTGTRRGKRTEPLRRDSRISVVSSNTYVPPILQQEAPSQRGERQLPESMDELFSSGSKKHSDRKKKKSTEERKKKKKSKSKSKELRTNSYNGPD